MGDCVKREDIINALHNIGGCGADNDPWAEGWDKAIDEAIRIVQNMPAAEASPITGELKPCPFCGGEAILSKEEIPDGNISYHTARIKCDDCGCATRQYIIDGYYGSTDTVADCINAWNDRKQNNSTPVVLCKNCKYASTNEFGVSSAIVLCSFGITKSVRQVDDFCIYGEKRSPDDEY